MNTFRAPDASVASISAIFPSAKTDGAVDPTFPIQIWREATRSQPPERAFQEIARVFDKALRVELCLLRKTDPGTGILEMVAASSANGRATLLPWSNRQSRPPVPFRRVWDSSRVRMGDTSKPDPYTHWLVPSGQSGAYLAGLLAPRDDLQGVLLLMFRDRESAIGAAREIFESALEPLELVFARLLEGGSPETQVAELGPPTAEPFPPGGAVLAGQSGTVIGEGKGLRDVIELINCVAHTDAPVLIMGETGVGKEVAARAIHDRSQRAKGPMIKVNCGAIPPELIDSELFGHERGSFTGAVAARKGWFERAHGGTLFLDEVGELPLDAQVRLLRVLQDGSFHRVGGQKGLTADVRIIAATHRDLAQMTAAGRFRRDLWYRISVFPLRIPPLRDRPEDVSLLASHFATRVGERLFGEAIAVTPEDVARLMQYNWPGNVRELAAVVERAAILGAGRKLELERAMELVTASPIAEGPREVHEEVPAGGPPPSGRLLSLEAVVVEHIEKALRATGGQIEGSKGAAAVLGINPHTLRARMRKFGIDWSRFRGRQEQSE